MDELTSALSLSLRIGLLATAVAAVVAVPLAYLMTRRPFRGRSLAEALILIPMVLPPTVIGYFIIVTLGARGWVGTVLARWFDYSLVFRFEGAVLAAAVVALPLLYLPARAGFAGVDKELEDAARIAGAGGLALFFTVSLPLARRGIVSGLLLAFARAVGEFGATLMVFGWQPGRLTLPISVYHDYYRGDPAAALPAVLTLSTLSLVLMAAYNRSAAGRQE